MAIGRQRIFHRCTVADITGGSVNQNLVYELTDAASYGDVATGGGSIHALIYYDGSAWAWYGRALETGADVTDATNVRAAGAVMEGSGNLTEDAVPVADASGDLIDGTLVDDGTYITGLVNTVSLQLSSDEVTLPTHTKPGIWYVIMEPETGTSDNCQDINGVVIGDFVFVRTKDTGDQITFKDTTGGGNLRHHMIGSVDLTLTIIPARIGYHCRTTGALDMFLESQP